MVCALCLRGTTDTVRTSGLEFCGSCRNVDPEDALAEHHGIVVAWDTRMLRFNASLAIPEQDPAFILKCVPRRWHHRFTRLVWPGIDVGDEEFDRRIHTWSSDPEKARALLRHEGPQSAILAFLSSVRDDELLGSQIALKGPTLTIGVRPEGTYDTDRIQELQLEAAALALHVGRTR